MGNLQFTEIQGRQERLLKRLGSDLLIIPAEIPRSSISKFRQGTNFFYLTGFPEYGAMLVLDPTSEGEQVSLFVRENSEKEQVWDGFTMGVDKQARLVQRTRSDTSVNLRVFSPADCKAAECTTRRSMATPAAA